jgi:hypothetical protein
LKVVEYVIIFDEGVRKRHYHETEQREVIKFVVQLEILASILLLPLLIGILKLTGRNIKRNFLKE